MPRALSREITSFARHVLVGDDESQTGEIARKWHCSTATITNLRKGKGGIGADVGLAIAEDRYGKPSLDSLREEAEKWAEANPLIFYRELIDEAFVNLSRRNPNAATKYAQAV